MQHDKGRGSEAQARPFGLSLGVPVSTLGTASSSGGRAVCAEVAERAHTWPGSELVPSVPLAYFLVWVREEYGKGNRPSGQREGAA